MKLDNTDEKLEEIDEKSESYKTKEPVTNIYDLLNNRKPHILANPNRSIGKGMNATHQTKKPHKPRKKK